MNATKPTTPPGLSETRRLITGVGLLALACLTSTTIPDLAAQTEPSPADLKVEAYRKGLEQANERILQGNETIRGLTRQMDQLNAELRQLKAQLADVSSNHVAGPWQPCYGKCQASDG